MLLGGAALAAQDPADLDILAANVVSRWRMLGPFPSPQHDGLGTAFIDEGAPDLTLSTVLPDGTTLRWTEPDAAEPLADGQRCQLDVGTWETVYLARTITAIADHDVTVAFGFDDSAALWVNGEEVFRKRSNQSVVIDDQRLRVRLRRGDNRVLLKIVNNEGECGFAFRLTDPLESSNRWGGGLPDDGFTNYRVSTVPVPEHIVLEVGGLLFLRDGSLLVACRRGQIYRIHNPGATDPSELVISTFATGLHEPLGLLLEADDSVLVAQMPELTRLRDSDGDGAADVFETVTADWGMSGNYHEYHFGPVRDGHGDLWCTLNIGFPSGEGAARRYRGSAYRVRDDGALAITCYGLRSPNGLVVNDQGDVFYTDNQGEWMDVCRLAHLQPRKFYGHPVATAWAEEMPDFGWETERTLPAVWYPYHLMRSTSQPVFDRSGGKFGPYAGQMFVGDQNNSLLVRTTLQRVDGVYQGACYPFWQAFGGGINRLAFDRHGVLYVGLTNRGWGSVRNMPHGLQRIEFVGPPPFDLLELRATHTGFDCEFTAPLAADVDLRPARVSVREYGYRYWSTYGSDEVDDRAVPVTAVRVSADRRVVSIDTGPRSVGKAFHVAWRGRLVSVDGQTPLTQEAFYTLLRIPAP